MTYTLLALHVEECTVSGLLLGFTQVCLFVGLFVCFFVFVCLFGIHPGFSVVFFILDPHIHGVPSMGPVVTIKLTQYLKVACSAGLNYTDEFLVKQVTTILIKHHHCNCHQYHYVIIMTPL